MVGRALVRLTQLLDRINGIPPRQVRNGHALASFSHTPNG